MGNVRDVTDETTLYFAATFGDLETSILPNLKLSFANLVRKNVLLV